MMRLCPKCGSYSLDGALAFCLVDGTPLVSVDPGSDKFSEGSRFLAEKENASRGHTRKLKWLRISSKVIITLIVIAGAYLLVASGFIGIERVRAVYKISGVVNDGTQPLASVKVVLEGNDKAASTTTDTLGNYSFSDLLAGSNYTISPLQTGKITFIPQSWSINNLAKNESADFTGKVAPDLYKITGRVTDEQKRSLPDIIVELKRGDVNSTQTTDPAGNYVFNELPAGIDYTVTPSRTDKVTFPEGGRTIKLTKDATADFTGKVTPDLYKITGRVTDEQKRSLPDIIIELKGGAANSKQTTNAAGNYVFSGLPIGFNYTITPSRTDKVTFPQGGRTLKLTKDATADFTGKVTPDLYKITGRVTDEQKRFLPDIIVELKGGAANSRQTTDAAGNYVFSGLPAGFSYTITPSRTDKVTFLPGGRSIRLTKDATADFTGNLKRDSVSECQGDKEQVKKIISAFLIAPQKEVIGNLHPRPTPSPAQKTEQAGGHRELEEGKSTHWNLEIRNHCKTPRLFRVKNKIKYLRFAQSTDSILVEPNSAKLLRGQLDATGLKSKKYRDKLIVECIDCKNEKNCMQDRDEFLVEMTVIKPRQSVDTQQTDTTNSHNVLTPTTPASTEQTSKSIGAIEEITLLEKCSLASVTIKYSSTQAALTNKNPLRCNKTDGKWRCDK
jgi:hypothetical protein